MGIDHVIFIVFHLFGMLDNFPIYINLFKLVFFLKKKEGRGKEYREQSAVG